MQASVKLDDCWDSGDDDSRLSPQAHCGILGETSLEEFKLKNVQSVIGVSYFQNLLADRKHGSI